MPDDAAFDGAGRCRLHAVADSGRLPGAPAGARSARDPAPLDVFAMFELPLSGAGGLAATTPADPDPLARAAEAWLIGPADPTTAGASAVGSCVLCRWRGADATAVETELRRLPVLDAAVWDGAVLDLSSGAGESNETGKLPINVVVEDSRTDGTVIRSIFPYDRQAPILIRHRVTLVRVALSLDGRHLLAFYHAPDIESVRRAQRDGGVCQGSVRACRPLGRH